MVSNLMRPSAHLLRFNVSLEGIIVVGSRGKTSDIESHLDQVMEELEHLRAGDPSIDATLSDGSVCISVVVDAPNPLDAVTQASGFIRSAIHAAGGGTGDWPDLGDEAWSMRLLSVIAGAVPENDPEPVVEPDLVGS